MVQITAALVKELREVTGAGMMDCKKALAENNGEKDASIDWLRQKGLSQAARKSTRVAKEGLVSVHVEGTFGAVVEVNSETDFVARNQAFQQFVSAVTKTALTVDSVDALTAAQLDGSQEVVQDALTNAISTIGENIEIRRMAKLSVSNGVVNSYVHGSVIANAGKIGVLVALESEGDQAKLTELSKKIAMHIAAARPEALTREELDPALIERERAVQIETSKESGKSAEIAEKMVEGRLRKFYEEVCLLEQVFLIDNKTKIRDVLAQESNEIGAPITLKGYACFVLGDGIEKEVEDFASEVAAVAGS